MKTTGAWVDARTQSRVNAVCHYVAYDPSEMPSVEVYVAAGGDGRDAAWAPGQLRMRTSHEDGSRVFTAQYRLEGRLLVANFPEDRVRRDPASP